MKKLLQKTLFTLIFTSLTTVIYAQTVTFDTFPDEIVAATGKIAPGSQLIITIDNIPDDNTTILANIRVYNTGSLANADKLLQTNINVDATDSTSGNFYTFVEAAGTDANTIKRTFTFTELVENTAGGGTGGSYVVGNEYDILVRLLNTASGTVDTNSNPTTMEAIEIIPIEITEINFDEGYTITDETNATHSVSNGELTITTTAEMSSGVKIDLGVNYIDASANPFAIIYYRNESTNTQFAFHTANNGLYDKMTGITTEMASTDPFEQSSSKDLSQGGTNTWTGNISTIILRPRINNGTTAAGNFTLDKIVFDNDGTLGVNNYEAKKIGVYPNPTADFISISTANNNIKSVYIYDVMGKQVKKFNNPTNMDVSNLSKGIYLIKTDTGKLSKFIKE
ncbi:T9SS type A sorting domain-containing protein [Lutibacter sp. TH_r2]|uniref:T9SS type A sorting domain-containing protein n=1 Tax=Lutibacter sp. TH_r2 TaxID=3082083 RepID=UPI0029558F5B|nr:T9SS type A sorting domain-containing protein [Lutibacter sp. TH_r2]